MFQIIIIFLSLLTFGFYTAVAYKIIIKPKLRNRSVWATNQANHIVSSQARQKKVSKTMAIIMLTYYLLYLPGLAESFFKYDPVIKQYIEMIVINLWFCNAQINPVIYFLTNKDFTAAFKSILRIKLKENETDHNLQVSTTQTVV